TFWDICRILQICGSPRGRGAERPSTDGVDLLLRRSGPLARREVDPVANGVYFISVLIDRSTDGLVSSLTSFLRDVARSVADTEKFSIVENCADRLLWRSEETACIDRERRYFSLSSARQSARYWLADLADARARPKPWNANLRRSRW